MRIDDLLRFMCERHRIYQRRQMGMQRPWTQDPILQDYRFCNVYRELDTETIWIKENWRDTLGDHGFLFFAMLVARVVNWHETLNDMSIPIPYDAKRFQRALCKRSALGQKVWTGAYMITTHRVAMPKEKYYAERVLQPIWDARKHIAPKEGDTLAAFHARLAAQDGIGDFLAAQVVADTKHYGHLRQATDWWTWAAMGEGSRRGLNRVFERPYKQRMNPAIWQRDFDMLFDAVTRFIQRERNHNLLPIDAQDLQNCLCEFDKYERVRLGQGRPRSRYLGRGE